MNDEWKLCREGEVLVEQCGVTWKYTPFATLLGGHVYRRGPARHTAELEGGYTYECGRLKSSKYMEVPPDRSFRAVVYRNGFSHRRYDCATLEDAMQKCLDHEALVRLQA